MIRLALGLDELVAAWVSKQLPDAPDFGKCTAIGVVDGNRMIAGVVYNNYHGHMIEASIAAIDPRWCKRTILRAIFSYPFKQLGVTRLQVTIAKRNKRARRFVERLGFKFEGVGRKALPDGKDAAVYSILDNEVKWIRNTGNE